MSAMLSEVATIFNDHSKLRCEIEAEPGLTITIVVRTNMQEEGTRASLDILALLHELQFLAGLSQVREFAARYGIDPAALEKLLPAEVPDNA